MNKPCKLCISRLSRIDEAAESLANLLNHWQSLSDERIRTVVRGVLNGCLNPELHSSGLTPYDTIDEA